MIGNGRLRTAVVGMGYWGPNIARNLAETAKSELTWVCDLDERLLAVARTRYPSARVTTSYDDLLNDPELDAIAIVTPVSKHYAMAAAALDAGKHVLVEKPLAGSSVEAADLIARAEDAGLVLLPGHTFLYSPSVVKIKEILDSGELGEIYFISMSRVNLGLHQSDVSVVWDLAPHDFSILSYWLGGPPSVVSALARSCVLPASPDVAFVSVQYGSGAVAHLELSWLSPVKLRRTAIVGSEKMVVYDDTSTEPVRIFDAGAELPMPETFGEFRLSYRTGSIVSPKIDATEPLSLEIADFVDSILEGRTPRSSARIGFEVIRAIEAVDASLASGGSPASVDQSSLPTTAFERPRRPHAA